MSLERQHMGHRNQLLVPKGQAHRQERVGVWSWLLDQLPPAGEVRRLSAESSRVPRAWGVLLGLKLRDSGAPFFCIHHTPGTREPCSVPGKGPVLPHLPVEVKIAVFSE